jgi:hypothetical protein
MLVPSADKGSGPLIASTHPIRVDPSSRGHSAAEISGIRTVLAPERDGPMPVRMREYRTTYPTRREDVHWILDPGWAVAYNALQSIPYWFDRIGREICLLCDGRHTFERVAELVRDSMAPLDTGDVDTAVLGFLLALQYLDLISWEQRPQ